MNSDLKTLSLIRVQVLIFASFMLLASFLLFWVYVKFSEGGLAFSLAMGIVFFLYSLYLGWVVGVDSDQDIEEIALTLWGVGFPVMLPCSLLAWAVHRLIIRMKE